MKQHRLWTVCLLMALLSACSSTVEFGQHGVQREPVQELTESTQHELPADKKPTINTDDNSLSRFSGGCFVAKDAEAQSGQLLYLELYDDNTGIYLTADAQGIVRQATWQYQDRLLRVQLLRRGREYENVSFLLRKDHVLQTLRAEISPHLYQIAPEDESTES